MSISDHSRRSISDAEDSASTTQTEYSSCKKSRHSLRGRHFVSKYGSRHHAYESGKAPWPLSYEKATLELEMMDTALTSAFKGVVSLVDHKGKEPARCLDIGTGLGLWVANSVKYWKHSTFVGFDLVDIQIPLSIFDPQEAARIEWVHGNFLVEPLPFDDEEFDHVRITQVSMGIPEHKWATVFEEIRRVMKPNGTIEIIEEDAIFPVLPPWFTEPLHARTRWPTINMHDGAKFFSDPQAATKDPDIAHEYELLELLFHKVFDRRFVNTKPSSTLPASFSTYFGHVIVPPVLTVPMPPLPPVHARPGPRTSTSSRHSQSSPDQDVLFTDAEGELSLATFHNGVLTRKKSSKSPSARKRQSTSAVPSSAASSVRSSPLTRSGSEHHSFPWASNPGNASAPASTTSLSGSGSGSGSAEIPPPVPPLPASLQGSAVVPVPSPGSVGSGRPRSFSGSSVQSMASKRLAAIRDLAADSTMMGARAAIELFPLDALLMFDMHSLCLHLKRALGVVLAVREAMWDELLGMISAAVVDERGAEDLARYGFFPHEDTPEQVRAKFVQLVEQYKSDMHVRMSLWNSLVHFGWEYPQRDPMSKAEEMEELRLREDILLARRKAGVEHEREPPCRAVRMLVGAKV